MKLRSNFQKIRGTLTENSIFYFSIEESLDDLDEAIAGRRLDERPYVFGTILSCFST